MSDLNIPTDNTFPTNTCLMQVRRAWDVPAKYPTAYQAWLGEGGAEGKNTHTVNYHIHGMPIFLKGTGATGHVCLYDRDGYVWTTDYPRAGRWNRVKLADLARAWRMRVLGGSEVLNGVRVLPHKSY